MSQPASPSPADGDTASSRQTGSFSRPAWLAAVRADQLLRWHCGERVFVETYLQQCPVLSQDAEGLLDLIFQEARLRAEHGETPTLEEYLRRFPEYADALRLQFASAVLATGSQGKPNAGSASFQDRTRSQGMTSIEELFRADDSNATDASVVPFVPPPLEAVHGWPTLPGYEILGELGRGGMGVVYKAVQTDLKRVVALKMILAGLHAGDQVIARFRAEAEALARLQHPNIVQVYEVGEHNGLPFFSLEFCPGGSLDKKIKGTPLPPKEAAPLIETLARAMHVAHRANIVHRDLKPANVLLAAGGTPKVTDFGLARRLDVQGLSMSGDIMGTPSYMAPEQATGKVKEIGPACDVYALGALLYELLTGRPPFSAPSKVDTILQVINDEPVPPRQFNRRLPRDLETICLKCLEKAPARRYGSAEELAEDLRHFQLGEPIRARPVRATERAVKWVRRRPAQAALVAALGVAVLAGVAGAVIYGLYQEQRAAALAQENEWERQKYERVNEARRKVDQHASEAQTAESAGRFDDAKSSWELARAALETEPDAAGAEMRVRIDEGLQRAQQQIAQRRDRDRLQAARRDFQERTQRFGRQRDQVLFRTVSYQPEREAEDAAFVHREAPLALQQLGLEVGQSPEGVASGLDRYRQVVEPAQLDRVAAECYQVLLVWAAAELGARTENADKAGAIRALPLLDAAAAVAKAHDLKPPRAFHLRRARCLELLGNEVAARGERNRAAEVTPGKALDLLEAALDRYRQGDTAGAAALCDSIVPTEALAFWAQYVQALCHLRERRWLAARFSLDRCLDRQRDSSWLLMLRALALVELKDYAAAEDDLAKALQDADPAFRAVVLTNRSVVYIRQQRWDEAEQDLRAAIRLQPAAYEARVNLARVYQDQHKATLPGFAASTVGLVSGPRGLGPVLAAAALFPGRTPKGEAALAEMAEAIKRRPNDVALYYTRARMQAECGDREAARRDFAQTIALEEAGSRSERLLSARVELAHLCHQEKLYKDALDHCDAALAVQPKYTPALRQRAETLLALGRYPAAGQALDKYLAVGGDRTPNVLEARGLIHQQLREYAQAIEAFTLALALRRDANVLAYRGWAYLETKAVQLAEADFEAALQLQADHLDALCGRGKTRALRGKTAGAAQDAATALRQGPRTARLLFHCACIHARCLEALASSRRAAEATVQQEKALELLQAALELVPNADRPAYWRSNCQNNPDLLSLHGSSGWLRLARNNAP
jgi:predicted Zn-dependent protease